MAENSHVPGVVSIFYLFLLTFCFCSFIIKTVRNKTKHIGGSNMFDNFSLVVILIVVFTLGYTVGRSDKFFGVEKKKEKF